MESEEKDGKMAKRALSVGKDLPLQGMCLMRPKDGRRGHQ